MDSKIWKFAGEESSSGFYGWKRKVLFSVTLLLISVIALNITLIFWVMKVLSVNLSGITYMQMIQSGVQFPDKTYIDGALIASGIAPRQEGTVSVRSTRNMTLRVTDGHGNTASNIQLGNGTFDVRTSSFKVSNPRGKTLFSVDKEKVTLNSQSLTISGEGGSTFEGSLQTPVVSAGIRSDLALESAMMGVQVLTPAAIFFESKAGDVLVTAHQDLKLVTVDGSIRLQSVNVMMPSLKHPPVAMSHHAQASTSHHPKPATSHHPHTHKHRRHPDRIYQLCVCDNGDLFLGEPSTSCDSGVNHQLCR